MADDRALNLNVERALLSTAIFDPESLEAMERVRPEHFAHPFHQTMWEAVMRLHGRGMPIDEVFVKQAIDAKAFDEVAFFDVLGANPISGVEAYVGDLIEKYRRRQVQLIATKMRQLAETEESIDDVIDQTTLALSNLGEDGGERHSVTFDEAKEYYEKLGKPPLYRTGVSFLDSTLSGGFQLGQLFFLSGQKESGKAQPVDEPVLTPDGWREIGSLREGDFVIGSDGRPIKVLGVFPQGVKPCYRVVLNDGSSTRCCDEHLWTVQTPYDRMKGKTRTVALKTIMKDYRIRRETGHFFKYYVPNLSPVQFSKKKLPLHPYYLGFLLGDGCFRGGSITFSNPNEEIVEYIESIAPNSDCIVRINENDWRVKRKKRTIEASESMKVIRRLGLYRLRSDEKFIPEKYLRGSVQQRKMLLWGLLDTDGYVDYSNAGCEFTTTSKQLAYDVAELVRSLGGRATITQKNTVYIYKNTRKRGRVAFRLHIALPNSIPPGLLRDDIDKFKRREYEIAKSIVDINRENDAEMVCIMVDAPDNLYVTRDYILTHNTFILTKVLENVSRGHKVGFFSLEFGSRMYVENMTKKHGSKYSNPNIYINDWAFDIAEVEREIRYQHKKNGVKFWGIDSQLRLTNKQMAGSTREMWLGDIFSRLARLAVTLDILIMIIVQVSKEGYRSDEPTVKGCVDADHEAMTWLHLTKLKNSERRTAVWVKNKQTYKHPKHILEFDPWNHVFREVKEDEMETKDGKKIKVEYEEVSDG